MDRRASPCRLLVWGNLPYTPSASKQGGYKSGHADLYRTFYNLLSARRLLTTSLISKDGQDLKVQCRTPSAEEVVAYCNQWTCWVSAPSCLYCLCLGSSSAFHERWMPLASPEEVVHTAKCPTVSRNACSKASTKKKSANMCWSLIERRELSVSWYLQQEPVTPLALATPACSLCQSKLTQSSV